MLPPDLEHAGLVVAVNGIVEVINKTGEIAIDYSWDDFSEGERNREKELGVYRIIHELIHNTLKYAKAKNISLNLEINKNTVSLSYADDGAGFDVEDAMDNGLGIRSILSRVEFLNAEYSFRSELGKGMEFSLKNSK